MTRRIPLVLMVAIAAVAVGVGAGMFSAARHSHAKPSETTTPAPKTISIVLVMHYTSRSISSQYVDSSPKGLSAGDVLTEHSIWYQMGTKAGQMAATMSVTQRTGANRGEVLFIAVARLKDGDVVMTGAFSVVPQNQTFQAAVTGGTGIFSGARGHALFRQKSGNRTLVTLYLTGTGRSQLSTR